MTETEVRAGDANAAEFSGQYQTGNGNADRKLQCSQEVPLTSLTVVDTSCGKLTKTAGKNQSEALLGTAPSSQIKSRIVLAQEAKGKLTIHGILNETGKFKVTIIQMLNKAEKD